MTVATTAYDAASFLYSGTNTIQTGVPAGSIQPTQVAALRGTVHDRVGQPVPGVRISVLNHAEYGQTLTGADGAYDLVVNGGQPLNVKYDRSDLLSVQRTVTAAWQEYTAVPDVVMVPYDQLSTVFAAGSTDTQVARGSTSIDELGSRQAT